MPEPKFLAAFSEFYARRFSVATEIPDDSFQCKCDVSVSQNRISWHSYQKKCGAFVGQDRNSWRYFPVQRRGVCRSEPKSLAVFSDLNAMGYSVRTEIPGGIYQFECEAFCGQNKNPRQYFPVKMRGVCRSEPEFLAVFTSVNARSYSV